MIRRLTVLFAVVFVLTVLVLPVGLARKAGEGRSFETEVSTSAVENFEEGENFEGKTWKLRSGHGRNSGLRNGKRANCYWRSRSLKGAGLELLVEQSREMFDLSEVQRERLEDLSNQSRERLADLRARVKKQQLNLKKLMQDFSPDDRAVMTAIDSLYSTKSELRKLEVGSRMEMRQVLGKEKWSELRESFIRLAPGRPVKSDR